MKPNSRQLSKGLSQSFQLTIKRSSVLNPMKEDFFGHFKTLWVRLIKNLASKTPMCQVK